MHRDIQSKPSRRGYTGTITRTHIHYVTWILWSSTTNNYHKRRRTESNGSNAQQRSAIKTWKETNDPNGHTMEPWKDFPQVQKANHRLEGEEIHRNAYSIKQTFITLILFTMLKKLKSKKHRTFTTLGRWDDLVSKTFSLVKINYFYNQSEYYGRV